MIKDGHQSLRIVELDLTNIIDINKVDSAFEVRSRIVPHMKKDGLAYINGEAVGQIVLSRWWNKLAWIEDIRVEIKYRRTGIATKLMDAAINWAREAGMPGIMIETQDIDVPACLFYQQYGFTLGGVDRMLYRGTGNSGETALFWYFIF
jgi:GNAT superfamily N-acetyltransferase